MKLSGLWLAGIMLGMVCLLHLATGILIPRSINLEFLMQGIAFGVLGIIGLLADIGLHYERGKMLYGSDGASPNRSSNDCDLGSVTDSLP